MKRRTRFLFTLPALAMLVACENASAPSDPPVVEPPAASAATPVEAPVAKPVEVTAPFLVMMDGPVTVPAGSFELTVTIDSPKGFGGETTVSLQLPAGAKLLGGEASEKLSNLPAGKIERTFKLSAPKLTADEPIKIVVEGQDPSGQFGARAVRAYPEPGSNAP